MSLEMFNDMMLGVVIGIFWAGVLVGMIDGR